MGCYSSKQTLEKLPLKTRKENTIPFGKISFEYYGDYFDRHPSDEIIKEIIKIFDEAFIDEPNYSSWRKNVTSDWIFYNCFKSFRIICLFVDSQLVSILSLSYDRETFCIGNVSTKISERTKGYMSMLFEEMYKYCQRIGINKLKLFVDKSKTHLVNYYEKKGFIKTNEEFERDGITEIFMEKNLI